ncbi:hypothetical protein TWF506_010855 [Arthrobotrys conoides]|uniref:Uncharacterized protein n=1 Tax=Arthrobotrys conoides TaxID=74498 RepID=A0AAN8RV23_9PEZI
MDLEDRQAGSKKIIKRRNDGTESLGDKPAVAELGTVALRRKPQLWAGYFYGMPMNRKIVGLKERRKQPRKEREEKKKKKPNQQSSLRMKRVVEDKIQRKERSRKRMW